MALNIVASVKLPVEEQSQVGEARRRCFSLCKEIGFDDVTTEKALIVVTELGTNLVKHASGQGRCIILQVLKDATRDHIWVEIYSIDKGKGITNLNAALNDGYSTKGTSGIGLGAVKRLSSQFDIFSQPENGVVIYSMICPRKHNPMLTNVSSGDQVFERFTSAQLLIPMVYEIKCGDITGIHYLKDKIMVMVADGLGHGEEAAKAAYAAKDVFTANIHDPPPRIIEKMHSALFSTRGAAVAIAEIDIKEQRLIYSGVGNISGRILNGDFIQNLVSYNGIVGGECRKIQEFVYNWQPGSILIMHSDGISAKWDIKEYQGIRGRSPNLIAALIYRDFQRNRDDASIVVIKENTLQP